MPQIRVSSGIDVPMDINVVIEIPAYSNPVKYEMDKETGALTVDRFMGTAMQYPTNYGYLPHSLSGDGDPVDVLVITPDPVLGGCVVRCRPIGILKMVDEAGVDNKVLAVPVRKLTSAYDRIKTYQDVSENRLTKIAHFFEHYKDLEEGKWVTVEGWFGIEDACEEILSSIARYDALEHKPAF
ncbi:MAG: inorganic diphosphatase [Methylococcaceae bacterium]|nr:inorganic diphosphatase [Methylococcaceae bacterium]MDD1615333.1 inorganic diphosphatase [Methylococcaceae bacterium]OYV20571.1 MAG: inorganic pyrophosphatase [Methylococcaceae bacterium NSP1-2]